MIYDILEWNSAECGKCQDHGVLSLQVHRKSTSLHIDRGYHDVCQLNEVSVRHH